MPFTLADLSDMQRRTLVALKEYNVASRQHLADKTKLKPAQVSTALNRFEALGFAKQGSPPSRAWSFTTDGKKLFDTCIDAPKPEPAPSPDKTPDIATPETPPESTPDQPVAEDKLMDKLMDIVTDIAADIRVGKVPTYPLSVVQEDYEPGPESVNPALVQESIVMTRPPRFTGLNDAMFVLDVLATQYCQQLPEFTKEISRISQFLQEAA